MLTLFTFLANNNPITKLVDGAVQSNTSIVASSIGLSVDLLILCAALVAVPLLLGKTIIKIVQVHGQPGGISQITGWLLTTLAALVVAILVAATPTPFITLWNKLVASISNVPTMSKEAAVAPIRVIYTAIFDFVSQTVLSIGDAAFFFIFLGIGIFGLVGGIMKILHHQDQEQFMGKAVVMIIVGVVALIIVAGWGRMGGSGGILTSFLKAVGAKTSA